MPIVVTSHLARRLARFFESRHYPVLLNYGIQVLWMPGDNLEDEQAFDPHLIKAEVLCQFWFSEEERTKYRVEFPPNVPDHQGGWLLLYDSTNKIEHEDAINFNNVLRLWLSGACEKFHQSREVEERRTESGTFYLPVVGCNHRKVAPVNRNNLFVRSVIKSSGNLLPWRTFLRSVEKHDSRLSAY